MLVRTGLGRKALEDGLPDFVQPVAVYDDLQRQSMPHLVSIACRGPLVFPGCFIDGRDPGRHLMAVVLQHLAKIARIEVGAARKDNARCERPLARRECPVEPE